jgi:hypothetical protein
MSLSLRFGRRSYFSPFILVFSAAGELVGEVSVVFQTAW